MDSGAKIQTSEKRLGGAKVAMLPERAQEEVGDLVVVEAMAIQVAWALRKEIHLCTPAQRRAIVQGVQVPSASLQLATELAIATL